MLIGQCVYLFQKTVQHASKLLAAIASHHTPQLHGLDGGTHAAQYTGARLCFDDKSSNDSDCQAEGRNLRENQLPSADHAVVRQSDRCSLPPYPVGRWLGHGGSVA